MSRLLTVAQAEELVAEVRRRHRERLEHLRAVAADQGAIERELFPPPPPAPSLWDRLWANLGLAPPQRHADELERLEEQIEVGQRLVVRLAHHLDTLHLDRMAQERERAEHAALAQASREEAARHEGQAAGVPHARVAARLSSVVRLHDEVLAVDHRITEGVAALHAAAAEALDAIDAQLSRAAAEARARDLAALLKGGSPLHEAVQRVRKLAGQATVAVDEGVDRLAAEVDLLAPADPDALQAEAEVAAYLRGDGG
jgi:hypothetical protein